MNPEGDNELPGPEVITEEHPLVIGTRINNQ